MKDITATQWGKWNMMSDQNTVGWVQNHMLALPNVQAELFLFRSRSGQ